MPSVVILGAGPAGLSMAMLLSSAGMDVTVLDKDPTHPPDDASAAWEHWSRPGVAQFNQAHTLLPRGASILRSKLPEVAEYLDQLGAHEISPLQSIPPTMRDWEPHPDDLRFASWGARRPVYELAFALAAATNPRIEIRRGVKVTGLVRGPDSLKGTPHVTGVRTGEGQALMADLVIDAGGRRSPVPSLLEEIGSRPPVEVAEDSRFVYYSRFYRKFDSGDFPEPYQVSLLPVGSISVLTLPGDNGTWSTTLYSTTADRAMRKAKDPAVFDRVLAAIPQRAVWGQGEPLNEVNVMAGIADRKRSLVVDDRPVVIGLISVADAWACTNPSMGRGISMALMHVTALIPAIEEFLDRPTELVLRCHETTQSELEPWHSDTLHQDQARNAEMDQVRLGSWRPTEPSPQERAIFVGMGTDPEIFRAAGEIGGLYATAPEVMSRPTIQARIADIAESLTQPAEPEPEVLPRSQLEALLR